MSEVKKSVRFPVGSIMPLWSEIEAFKLNIPAEHSIEDVMQSDYFTPLHKNIGRHKDAFAILRHKGGQFTIGVMFTKCSEREVLFDVLFGNVEGGVISKPEITVSTDSATDVLRTARVEHGGDKTRWRILAADGRTLEQGFGSKREAEAWLAAALDGALKKAA